MKVRTYGKINTWKETIRNGEITVLAFWAFKGEALVQTLDFNINNKKKSLFLDSNHGDVNHLSLSLLGTTFIVC